MQGIVGGDGFPVGLFEKFYFSLDNAASVLRIVLFVQSIIDDLEQFNLFLI
jgi:hypothetical protein